MSPLSQHALEIQEPQSLWDTILETLLVALLAFAPFAFGAVDAWAEELVLAAAALLAIVLAGKLVFRRDVHVVWTWAYVPVVLFLLFAAVQLVPLPARIVGAVSPATLQTRTELLSDLPGAPSLLERMTLSFYPLATREDLRMVLAVATVFVVVVNVYRRSGQIKRLLLAIAAIGTSVALLAAWQNLTHDRSVYGMMLGGHPNSGPFMNHSHFGQFMNLSIGAMLAFMLVRIEELTKGSDSFEESFRAVLDGPSGIVWALGAAAALSAAMIFFSLTRGGVTSLAIAGVFTGLLFAWRRASLHTVLGVLAIAVILGVLNAGYGMVFERLATLRNVSNDNGDRVQMLRDVSRAWRMYPAVGTGLGTYQYVFPMFDRQTNAAIATHAENEYAQIMEECGGIGFGLTLLFMGIIAAAYFRCVWKPKRSIHLAAYGLGFGLLAILIHSLSDFGQHVPANACLTATCCGLLVSLSRIRRSTGAAPPRARLNPIPWIGRPLRVAGAVLVAAVFVLPLLGAHRASREEEPWHQARRLRNQIARTGWDKASDADYIAVLKPASQAAAIEPDDVTVQYWLNDIRWHSISRVKSGPLLMSAQGIGFTSRIVNELHHARPLCPTYAPLYSLAGELEYFVLHQPQGAGHIREGYRLDPNYPTTCFALAELEADQGHWAESEAAARRTLVLGPGLLSDLLTLYVSRGRSDLAYALVEKNGLGLFTLADLLGSGQKDEALAAKCRSEATAMLLIEAGKPDASPTVLAQAAEIYAARDNNEAAIDCYGRALAGDFGQVGWRFRLAQLLEKSGRTDEAIRQARICLRFRPQMKEAEDLVETAGLARR